jgi:3D (Asp-Asp-Asp) domain-containing protein
MRPATVALALAATTAASVTAIATHHHKHVTGPRAASALAPVVPLTSRASRAHTREPSPPVKSRTHPGKGAPMLRVLSRSARPAGGNGTLADVTMYCATGNRNAAGRWPELGDVAVMDRSIPFGTRVVIDGNVYTVRDWIGWGSDFDIYGGDAGCKQRAVNFGRRHLRVVVER